MSPINDPESHRRSELARSLAEGKITCACGNDDWRGFLFIGAEKDTVSVAGCKRCGRGYMLQDGAWVLKSEPPR